jgi:sulfatase maturation enzyme AslB (radical SAM superfamily)
MPFKINDLILSVDPVKLYEYVNFNKNIITVHYEEIERFHEFVHFYNDTEEYLSVIKELKGNNTLKYSNEQRQKFLVENTWNKRVEQILNKLENNLS